jgi:hypothetical protein
MTKYFSNHLFIGICFLASSVTYANTDPTMTDLKIYGVAVSENTDCSNAKVVGNDPAGTNYDFLTGPSLATGNIPVGTYQCLILYMDDILTFKSLATTGSCTAGTTVSRNLCHDTGGGAVHCMFQSASPDADLNLVYDATETQSTATDSLDVAHSSKVLLFLSTASTGDGTKAFRRPTAGNLSNGYPLTSPLVVTAAGKTGTFVVDFRGQVDGSGGSCDLGPPVFGFR